MDELPQMVSALAAIADDVSVTAAYRLVATAALDLIHDLLAERDDCARQQLPDGHVRIDGKVWRVDGWIATPADLTEVTDLHRRGVAKAAAGAWLVPVAS